MCEITGKLFEESSHVVGFVKAGPHLGQHLHVFYHQFLHRHKHRTSDVLQGTTDGRVI